jgi:hypothetical protein
VVARSKCSPPAAAFQATEGRLGHLVSGTEVYIFTHLAARHADAALPRACASEEKSFTTDYTDDTDEDRPENFWVSNPGLFFSHPCDPCNPWSNLFSVVCLRV